MTTEPISRVGTPPASAAGPRVTCVSCGSIVPAGARFCPSCGHPLAAGQNDERRIVTVLFADLVGFTSLAEFIDPEQAKRMIDTCFARLVDDVTAFGGRVDKILGDGILALFGAPVAHEDDPERAVRAALRMQASLAAQTARPGFAAGAEIRMRVGINTGEVLVGMLAGTDYTAMGDVVNTASRLQALAPPGRVIVGAATHALTAHAIGYEDAGELIARGREQGISAWLALAPTAPPGVRRGRRHDVAMVGRDAECSIGLTALEMSIASGRGVLLSVSGESGLGKSRLVDELLARLRDAQPPGHKPMILQGACVPYGEANVWWPVATAVVASLGLDVGRPAEEVCGIMRARADAVAPMLDSGSVERIVEVFLHLLGHPSPIDRLDPASARTAIHWGVGKLFHASAAARPTVLFIDNLHWADPLLIDLLEHLVQSLSRSPFALVTTMRPGSELPWPPRTERETVVSMALRSLSREENDELAISLLADCDTDQLLLAGLYDRSGGNPLFLQELAALTEVGAPGVVLPDSLRTLVAARLDQLTARQRQVIDNAATLGTSGNLPSLERFAGEMGQLFDAATVVELDDFGLLDLNGSRWQFRSESVREAAYQTLTKTSRAHRHVGVARALQANSPKAIDEIAHHLATAAELVCELGHLGNIPASITPEAIDALTSAATRALVDGSFTLVVRHASRALDLLAASTPPTEQRAGLHLLRAEAHVERRSYQAAHADVDAALAYAEAAGDAVVEGVGRRIAGNLHHAENHLDLARDELGRSVEILREQDRPRLLAESLRNRGFIELFGGSLIDAEWFLGEADAIFRALDDRRGMAWVEQHRAWIGFFSGDFASARERLEHAAATLDEVGDRNGVGWAFGLLAFVEFFEGNFAEAERLAVLVGAEAEDRGDTWAEAMMQTLLANLRMWQGDLDHAIAAAERARVMFRKIDDKFGVSQALAPLLRAQTALGQTAAAQRTAEELTTLVDTTPLGPGPLLALAGAAMHRGDGPATAAFATRAIADMRGAGSDSFEPLIILSIGMAQSGYLDDALSTIDSVGAAGDEHPFTNAAAALIHALAHDPQRALTRAGFVADPDTAAHHGVTYFDRIIAEVAAAGAHAQLGGAEDACLHAEAAVVLAMHVGDVVAIALATRCFAVVTGREHPAYDEHTVLGAGWVVVVDGLVDTLVR